MKPLSKNLSKNASRSLWRFILLALWPILLTACLKHISPPPGNDSHGPASSPPILLLSQAQFQTKRGADGEDRSIPGSAKLTLVRQTPNGWESSLLEDPESNVFHKALWFTPPAGAGDAGILTIAGNAARLKLWHREGAQWKGTTLWGPAFGGEQNRLRDIEVGDVTGDGVEDLVIATHDQGIVAVLQWKEGAWDVTELDRTPDTFVHEVEIGDIDHDGTQEFFATPSAPNRLDGTPQPGKIMMHRFDGERFASSAVEEFPARHVKEVLAADVSGSGYPDLFAAIEGEMAMVQGQPTILDTVKIKQYRFSDDPASVDKASGSEDRASGNTILGDTVSGDKISGGKISGKVIADLPDILCRNLTAGDVDGDGSVDIVASTMRSGIWILRQKPHGEWKKTLIDEESSGFEHATLITDLDHDGKNEIYVASDDQHFLRRYQWNGKTFQRDNLTPLQPDDFTFSLTVTGGLTFK